MPTFFERLTKNTEQEKLQEQEKERQMKRWLTIERARKKREIYETKEISWWMYVGPIIGLIAAIIAGLLIKVLDVENNTVWWFVGVGITPLLFCGVASKIKEGWTTSIIAKEKLREERGKDDTSNSIGYNSYLINGFEYKDDYLYTDDFISYWVYKLTKFVLGFSTIAFGLITAVLLFIWSGSIAPTTVIIILLMIIIFNQSIKS